MIFPQALTVEVSDDDIRAGLVGSCGSCPIALAAVRASGAEVRVGPWTIDVLDSEAMAVASYQMPDAATAFVWRFDNGHQVRPLSFVAELCQ